VLVLKASVSDLRSLARFAGASFFLLLLTDVLKSKK